MWKCKKCGGEILANCYHGHGPIIVALTKKGCADEEKIYNIDLCIYEYFCENYQDGECDNRGNNLEDIAEWEED